MEKIKKFANTLIIKSFTLLILLLIFSFGSLFAKGVLAQEATQTEEQIQQSQPQQESAPQQETSLQEAPAEINVDNNAEVQNSVEQTSDTGNNTIQTEPSSSPEPSPSPSVENESLPELTVSDEPSPSPEPTPDTNIDNQADVTNNVESLSDTGSNSMQEAAPEANLTLEEATSSTSLTTGESASEINTGDAVSVVEAENSINSTEVNSNVVNQTLNIFLSGDVDLSVVPYIIAEAVFAQNNQNSQVINVAVFNGNSYAYLSNDIVSTASTGANSINGEGQATISTGDSYSVVSLVNRVNTTIIDSTIHIVTINIFGTVEGDIILPELKSNGNCCGKVNQIDNKADVENNVLSSANSGQNEIVTTESGTIETGEAVSAVNVVNIVNKSLIDVLFQYLYINNFGFWDGDFLGWDEMLAYDGGGSLSLASVSAGGNGEGCGCADEINLQNEAVVVNNISSASNTGGNKINGGDAKIKTGKAYSAVSLLNFVNASFIRSIGFFAFVNIFGSLNGDIGGESQFQTPEDDQPEGDIIPGDQNPDPNQNKDKTLQNNDNPAREQGGKLEVKQTNSIGEYVLPGDTITFFVTVKNPGSGKVYGAKARISFILDGVDLGGATFELGDIEAGRGVKLSTGLVLSKDIKPGSYIARVRVWGQVGEDGLVADIADSAFLVGAPPFISGGPGILGEVFAGEVFASEGSPGEEILGIQRSGLRMEQKVWILLALCLGTLLILRGIRERKKLALALLRSKKVIINKSLALRSVLFSHFPPFF